MDFSGRIIAYGDADHHGDLYDDGRFDCVDFAPTPSGAGYWILTNDGVVHPFGDAVDHGDSSHTGTHPNGTDALARSIESHPSTQGYWVLWTDGAVTAHNLTNHGSASMA